MPAQESQSGADTIQNIYSRLSSRPYLVLTMAVLAILACFMAKPFNVDDPLFLWAAHHIQAHPANPYGFDVNWYGQVQPMWDVTKNPPLACYYLAAAAAVLGWSEFALHLAFMLPAIAVILGTFRLASHFCGRPLFAAGIALFTPVFLISSSTVMCDVLMLSFWMWAAVLWVEGLDRDHLPRLIFSGLLITLAALTKYYGACLIPLLAAYSIVAKRRLAPGLACLLIPVAALLVYQFATQSLYGRGLLSDAGGYVVSAKARSSLTDKEWSTFTTLTFTGGCLAIVTFLSPFLWRPRDFAIISTITICVAVMIWTKGAGITNYGQLAGPRALSLKVQIVLWAFGGTSVLYLAASDILHRRDAQSYLLAFWIFGTFAFAAFCNWVINGRSLLPMVPAAGILVVRQLERRSSSGQKIMLGGIAIAFAAGALLAIMVAQADCQAARAARQSAEAAAAKYGRGAGTLWFRGHWGFQYYMQSAGAKALDASQPASKPGDYLAIPFNNANNHPPDFSQVHLRDIMITPGPRWLANLNSEAGAGFYASNLGPLPFVFGQIPPERVFIYLFSPAPKPALPP